MVEFIPKWIWRRYFKLRREFGNEKFTFKKAQEILEDDSRIVNLFLSHLKKAGWLISEQHPKDARMKLYQLKAWGEIGKEMEQMVK